MFLLCGETTSQGNKEPATCCTVESTVCCTVWSVLLVSEPSSTVALALSVRDQVQTVSLGWLLVPMEQPGQPPARRELPLLQLYWSGLIVSPEVMPTAWALVAPVTYRLRIWFVVPYLETTCTCVFSVTYMK